ncbi:unnamed protein product [Didymodactylos carnosus]|uniref:Phytanoyl-CoA dioxygenase n=1 Tax=Didymodactylos carnosus TaxID=1234261 RepID=A0A814GZ81_9BILA|nr:unnamed protein product [Didymodactylos carnosus]CAF3774895.1 unnamed protein product [Didymodactylos carnosus]
MAKESTLSVKSAGSIDFTFMSPRFSTEFSEDISNGIAYLEEHGYVVWKDIANENEIKKAYDLFWDWAEQYGEHDISRYNVASWRDLPCNNRGIIWNGGIGQSHFLWYIRGLPNVKKVFSTIWNDDKLLVSYDGCSVFRPSAYNPTWQTEGGWYHVDQNPKEKPGKECIQGLFSVLDQNETTGGLVVVPGSHKHFASLRSITRDPISDLVEIPSNHWTIQRPKPRLVKCKAGDLVLWDSRTIHCNSPALVNNPSSISPAPELNRLMRLVAYICMTPVSKAGSMKDLAELREGRLEAVQKGITTNHWPHEYYGGCEPSSNEKNPHVQLNEQQMNLVVGK